LKTFQAYAEIVHLRAGTNVKIITAAFSNYIRIIYAANTEYRFPAAFIMADSWDGAQLQHAKTAKAAKSPPAAVSA